MARKKKTAEEKQAEHNAKERADEIILILVNLCDLLDLLLEVSKPNLPLGTDQLIDRMRAFLDKRGFVAEDPSWIMRMRRTVTNYTMHRGRLRGEDAFSID